MCSFDLLFSVANPQIITSGTSLHGPFPGDSGYFLFFPEKLKTNIRGIKEAFASAGLPLQLAYSIKANPFGAVLQTCSAEGISFECASMDEVARVHQYTGEGSAIHVNTPWLGETFMHHCIDRRIPIYLDGWKQIAEVERLAGVLGMTLDVGVRLHVLPENPSRFGVPATGENLRLLREQFTAGTHLRLVSLHCHYSGPDRSARHFELRGEAMKNAYEALEPIGTIESLNMGGGLMGPIPAGQEDQWDFHLPTWGAYARALQSVLGETIQKKGLRVIIEPGSALVADTVAFVAEVVALKENASERLAIVNTSNTVLRPTGHRRKLSFEVIPGAARSSVAAGEKQWEIVGNTCMENDRITGFNGALQTGDRLVFNNMGAYTISFANNFIYHQPEIRIFES